MIRPTAPAAALLALVACDGPFIPPPPYPPPPGVPATVLVTPDSGTVTADDTLRLSASVRDSSGAALPGTAVSWVSADTTIAVLVNALGTVRGQRPGVVRIRAFAGTAAGAVTVFVTPIVYTGVSAGADHVCAVANNQHAYCWGNNDDAQVGTGAPSLVEPVSRLVALVPALQTVAAGGAHSCALDVGGTAYCWGRETNGRLGRDGTPGDPAVPAAVVTGLRFIALAAGGAHTCGVTSTSQAACWGAGTLGQVGDGGMGDRTTPHAVMGDMTWRAITAGAFHTCALTTDSTAACWGANASGQLGDGTTVNRPVPTAVGTMLRFAAIGAGGGHTCAVTGAGVAFCWGRNTRDQTGTGLPDSMLVLPTSVGGGLVFHSVAVGGEHTCAIAADDSAYCWGANGSGQLGDSSRIDRALPVSVAGGLHYLALQAGAAFTCGLTNTLVLYCWGDGTQGQLGRPLLGTSTVPVKVAGQ
jgi:alpha-tubulin suppressor-like RCC1 family protein